MLILRRTNGQNHGRGNSCSKRCVDGGTKRKNVSSLCENVQSMTDMKGSILQETTRGWQRSLVIRHPWNIGAKIHEVLLFELVLHERSYLSNLVKHDNMYLTNVSLLQILYIANVLSFTSVICCSVRTLKEIVRFNVRLLSSIIRTSTTVMWCIFVHICASLLVS